MINIVKKYLWRRIHELNTLISSSDDSLPQAQNKYIVNIRLLQNNYWWLYLHIFFHLKDFLQIGPQFLFWNACTLRSSFRISLIVFKFDRWSCSKNEPNTRINIYFLCTYVSFLQEKRHKKWNQDCKQKQSLLFNFCDIFYLLTSSKEHGGYLFLNIIFAYFPVMNNWGKFKEISSTIFYCIIRP